MDLPKTDKCPFFYFSDVVVGETTCDGKKKMYEYMSEFKDVFIMELPNSQREPGLQLWKGEIIRFKEYLEQKFGMTITEEQIREAVKTENQARRSLKKLYEVMKYVRLRSKDRICSKFCTEAPSNLTVP